MSISLGLLFVVLFEESLVCRKNLAVHLSFCLVILSFGYCSKTLCEKVYDLSSGLELMVNVSFWVFHSLMTQWISGRLWTDTFCVLLFQFPPQRSFSFWHKPCTGVQHMTDSLVFISVLVPLLKCDKNHKNAKSMIGHSACSNAHIWLLCAGPRPKPGAQHRKNLKSNKSEKMKIHKNRWKNRVPLKEFQK